MTRLFLLLFGLAGCNGVNIFTVQDDIELGAQLRDEILANPADYPVLSESQYPEAYGHLDRIAFDILDQADVALRDELDWTFYLIEDDDTLNAFAAPGGYVFVYTGIIKFLEREDDLAGVMGHEIAHAAGRHSTEQLTAQYGAGLLLDIVLGEGTPRDLSEIAYGLGAMGFGRGQESESDEYSVRYLCETDYAANGAAGFFEAIGEQPVPEFLSTHPDPANRVEDINSLADELGCDTSPNPNAQFQAFLSSLP